MMSELPALKLIQVVDPTKIKVTVNEKFAKLTLSSNKKKEKEINDNEKMNIETEKRRSASRNLLSELNDNNENGANEVSNVLFKSKSSSLKEEDVQFTASLIEITQNEGENQSSSVHSMERLQLSYEVTEQQINESSMEDLVNKISSMSVGNLTDKKEIKDTTNPQTSMQTIDTIEISSSSDNEESIICLSDTSIEDDKYEEKENPDYMTTSDIAQSDKTGKTRIPCTLSNNRADRIEAFLRDVSQERHNIEAIGGYLDDSLMVHLNLQNKNNDNEKNFLDQAKAKLIAIADTESMTLDKTDSDEKQKEKKRNLAFDDTEVMSESFPSTLAPRKSKSFHHSNEKLARDIDDAARRLANDDTEANTTSNSLMETSKQSSEIEEDSIIISETSSEVIDESPQVTKSSSRRNKTPIISENAISEVLTQNTDEISEIGINISAKINIKLKINVCSSEELSENEYQDADDNHDDEVNQSKNITNGSSNGIENESQNNNDCQRRPSNNLKKAAEITQSGANFMTHSKQLLNELYGNTWQTPKVIRSLKKTKKSIEKLNNTVSKDKSTNSGNMTNTQRVLQMPIPNKAIEQSVLDDFSTFQRSIVETNLDSTRLHTPISKILKPLKSGKTEPRTSTEFQTRLKENTTDIFKRPQTEIKKTKIKSIQKKERWLQLVDKDDENENDTNKENITDDENIDKTLMTDDEENCSNASDSSWRKSLDSQSSDDEEIVIRKKPKQKNNTKRKQNIFNSSGKDCLIYLDLSKDKVTVSEDTPQHNPTVNNDEYFQNNLSKFLTSCQYEPKPQLEATPKTPGKSKRKLFNVDYGNVDNDDSIVALCRGLTPKQKSPTLVDDDIETEEVRLREAIPSSFNILNKRVEAVKTGKPVFKITPTRSKQDKNQFGEKDSPRKINQESINTNTPIDKRRLDEISSTPNFKYGFLKSLDVCVGKSLCHPDALVFRNNFRQKKDDLAKILYELFNSKVFNNELNVPIVWNKKLQNTAGRCLNKKKLGNRLCLVELSDKVLTSADRLRCTLIHELCHAATWIFDGEGGHGAKWKEWARKANAVFPDLPKIGVCHQYDIEYKYTYKCTLCAAKSHYHSKSKKVENIRCSYCYGAIEIFLNKKDKDGNIIPTPIKEPTGFAKFVKDKYHKFKGKDMKHADIMKQLSSEFAALKVAGNAQ